MNPQEENSGKSEQISRGRDLRAYASGTTLRLVLGGLAIVLIAGNVLIWVFYGRAAVQMSLLCMGVTLLPGLLIAVVLWVMGWIVRKERDA
ncbi:MAG: hypothetical protein WBB65_05090 [Anaerolineales bacterium]